MDFSAPRARLISHLRSQIKDERVLSAMATIPRELFVPPDQRLLAYEDIPLPIGLGQTISQPLIVGLMAQALELTGREKVLEVGTGSGYHAAVLSCLARQVITVERLPALAETAKKVLYILGYDNVVVHTAGETLGWLEEAPYDAILVAAAAPGVPSDLVAQLAIGGRMVIPAGSLYAQDLYKITRQMEQNKVEDLGGCRFVSLIGKGAWEAEKGIGDNSGRTQLRG
ncbi:MAG: protein-L-isoaspartate(D-aspartate) O-methyltransferase [Chloroflexi bacterium]|nr:protein-L-isoaspartate(D-aspartate) O-methyltransferase [Chloroflexota bacterium]